jgi:hypothetical protein
MQDGVGSGGRLLEFLDRLLVERITSLILQRVACFFTSSMTGRSPVPVPITRRLHFQGISSSTEIGVCPKAARNFLDGFFFRFRILPRSITTSYSWAVPSMRIEPNETSGSA